jgi:D-glycero-alpha-D-manno-heptose-7-phosphate kinase
MAGDRTNYCPTIAVRAPLRISFGGGGTDLEAYYARHGGFVVSTAIARYCYVVADETADGSIRINSADYRLCESFEAGVIPAVEEPLALPKAALEWFATRGRSNGHGKLRDAGVSLFLASEVPPGTGLGSSSAMAVALLLALATRLGMTLDAPSLAERAAWLEIERLGMPIGKQDQYASAFGGLKTIEFAAGGQGAVRVRPLGLRPDALAALNERLLLVSTGQSRHSAQILRQQRADTDADPAVVASLHRIKALAGEMCEALLREDLDHFGRLLDLGWQQKKRLSGRVSSTAIDDWYAAAREAGALGGKITGAGGGGFLLLYCPPHAQATVRTALAGLGLRELPFDFDRAGAQVLAADEADPCVVPTSRGHRGELTPHASRLTTTRGRQR